MYDYSNKKIKNGKITKTHKALKRAFFTMLNSRSFSKISVNDLCEEALVSRSTFYVYFNDKFDLLKYCMDNVRSAFELYAKQHTEKQTIDKIIAYTHDNAKLLKNLLDDNNTEVMVLLIHLLTPSLNNLLSSKEKSDQELTVSHYILSNFCAGGIANLLLWQIRNNFPLDKELLGTYLYNLQKGIITLDLNSQPE